MKEDGKSSGQISDFTLGMSYPSKDGTSSTYIIEGMEPTISYNLDSYVGYSTVQSTEVNKGKTIRNYVNYNDFPNVRPTLVPNNYLTDNEKKAVKMFRLPSKNIENNSAFRGQLLSEYFYKEGIFTPIKYTLFEYKNKNFDLLNIDSYYLVKRNDIAIQIPEFYPFNFTFSIKRKENLLSKKTAVDNFNGAEVSQTFDYEYLNNSNITKSITSTRSDGNVDVTKYLYSTDKNNVKLNDRNMVGIPLETEILKNGKTISKIETKYDNPSNLFPTSILSSDLQNTLSTEITYDQYDSKGNILQYTTKDGIATSVIWGYSSTQPIAKLTGVPYSVAGGLAAEIISASNADINASSEQALIDKLDAFRKQSALQNAQIATYTYDPLVGVTSITPPSGIREVYLYDTANRLKEIREDNAAGKILKEFKYNYKP